MGGSGLQSIRWARAAVRRVHRLRRPAGRSADRTGRRTGGSGMPFRRGGCGLRGRRHAVATGRARCRPPRSPWRSRADSRLAAVRRLAGGILPPTSANAAAVTARAGPDTAHGPRRSARVSSRLASAKTQSRPAPRQAEELPTERSTTSPGWLARAPGCRRVGVEEGFVDDQPAAAEASRAPASSCPRETLTVRVVGLDEEQRCRRRPRRRRSRWRAGR